MSNLIPYAWTPEVTIQVTPKTFDRLTVLDAQVAQVCAELDAAEWPFVTPLDTSIEQDRAILEGYNGLMTLERLHRVRSLLAFGSPTPPAVMLIQGGDEYARPDDEHLIDLACHQAGCQQWEGTANQAGWTGEEWTCPRCGGADKLRVVADRRRGRPDWRKD